MPKIIKGQTIGKLANKAGSQKPKGPLWLGPMDGSDFGGVTQGYINNFLTCRERFRLRVVEGLQPAERFNVPIDFGQMFHLCEEYTEYEEPLKNYAQKLCVKFPLQQEEVHKWWQVCKLLYPIYKDYWAKHQTKEKIEPLMREQVFKVPYELPSGRTVYLRGKFDGVDLAGNGKDRGIYLFETKTKSDIDEARITRQMGFDLQVLFYIIALDELRKHGNR